MLKKLLPFALLLTLCVLTTPSPLLGYARFARPRLISFNESNRPRADYHFNLGREAFNRKQWQTAAKHFKILTRDFHPQFYPNEVHYLLGLSFYELNELDLANQAWNVYIAKETNAAHLNEVMQAKMSIAKRCFAGAQGRLFGIRSLPKWGASETLTLSIYDEIIATLPTSDLAAESLVGRGRLLCRQGAFQEAIDSLCLMVKRFPQHEITPESYLAMQEVYLAQAKSDGQNPDTLSLAEAALNRFANSFPKDERLEEARQLFATLRDVQAYCLFRTAVFFRRIKQPNAAIIYCNAAIRQFPDTPTAERCRNLIACLKPCADAPALELLPQAAEAPSEETALS